MEEKQKLQARCSQETGIVLSGLSGYYVYFVLLCHKWLAEGAVSCWLIPQEFLYVNYGSALKTYLLSKVNLKRIHLFDTEGTLFGEAEVSSCLLWFTNESSETDSLVLITAGTDACNPDSRTYVRKSSLNPGKKWNFHSADSDGAGTSGRQKLGDYFTVKRGIATGSNDFFLVTKQSVEKYSLKHEYLKPVLPSPRYMSTDIILGNAEGEPVLENPLYLISTRETEENIRKNQPELWEYLKSGIGTVSEKYLCRKRKVWFWQEFRETPLFLCPYLSRNTRTGTTFRPILNLSNAVGTNSYLLLYPKENLQKQIRLDPDYVYLVWNELKKISAEDIRDNGRSYGGGLKKLEPKELPNIPCKNLLNL